MTGSPAVLQYQRQSVLTAPPVKIVTLLYERAIRCLAQAEADLAEKRYDAVAKGLGDAQEIVGELLNALDHEAGGEIAGNLQRLYTFVLDAMMSANIDQDAELLAQVRTILTTLYEAWDDISRH
jgi:flagellar protein FliS